VGSHEQNRKEGRPGIQKSIELSEIKLSQTQYHFGLSLIEFGNPMIKSHIKLCVSSIEFNNQI